MIYIWYVIYELHLSINIYMHTHTHVYIQICDIHLIYDIWIASVHQHTHDHTCPDRRHYLPFYNSLSFKVYTYTYTDTHTYTFTFIHADIWYTSIHRHTHDHTCPDSRHNLAACNSLSFNVCTDTHVQIHMHTRIHVYIQIYDIHLIYDIRYTCVR